MRATARKLRLDEFLQWERSQDLRYEFDGLQPIAMTGASLRHERLVARLIVAAGPRLRSPCEIFASGLKVIGEDRVHYPDVTIACGAVREDSDEISPTIVCEVTSPSSQKTDRHLKTLEYRQIPSILAYVILSQDMPDLTVLRRANSWLEENLSGLDAVLTLPEVGIQLPLAELYR